MEASEKHTGSEAEFYRRKFFLSSLIPFVFVFTMWLTFSVERLFNLDFSGFGIHPLSADGLPGIILSPFIHSGLKHLFNNTVPLFLLAVALFFFYSEDSGGECKPEERTAPEFFVGV